MATINSISQSKKFRIFLNMSFLLLLCISITTRIYSSNSLLLTRSRSFTSPNDGCRGLERLKDQKTKCSYLKSKNPCVSQGYINYLQFFYCICGKCPALGYALLALWLLVLFYLLGNTASEYFCSSLESLTRVLKLSPTIAGVTILALGNGAPDVFASIISFIGNKTGDVGLNSILGGAFFVSSVVVGIISISVSTHQISIHKSSFIRDVCFLLITLCSLLAVLIVRRINIWGALAFSSLYLVYVFIVSITHFCMKNNREVDRLDSESSENGELVVPLLRSYGDRESTLTENEGFSSDVENAKMICSNSNSSATSWFARVLCFLELPLYLPRRLTIPVICEERWSKLFAVASVTLAPVLLAFLWNSQTGDIGLKARVIYICGGLIGIILGLLAFFTTEKSSPPKRFVLPWLAGGFLMSVIWTYIIAEELIALLVSLGSIFGISPSILGLTVLAWGNSVGDLIANVTMAVNGGSDGVQVATSGCYAGPIFNTLVGLGLSLVFSSWHAYPSCVVIPNDPSLFVTLGFLVAGLLWALVILPRRNMKLDSFLGGGLLAIYLCFLSLRLTETLTSL
ncbi:cation/calcium exchanger 1-like [Tasmannia lanceolata]|uniref:cation/calcium exchanger 1-like n=1 Tax=Tasmannia lanceolata TaxID=3420 RepID=UPI0040628B37